MCECTCESGSYMRVCMWICMFRYMWVSIWVCGCVSVYVCVGACMNECAYMCVGVCTSECIRVWVGGYVRECICTREWRTCTCEWECMYVCTGMYKCICVSESTDLSYPCVSALFIIWWHCLYKLTYQVYECVEKVLYLCQSVYSFRFVSSRDLFPS